MRRISAEAVAEIAGGSTPPIPGTFANAGDTEWSGSTEGTDRGPDSPQTHLKNHDKCVASFIHLLWF